MITDFEPSFDVLWRGETHCHEASVVYSLLRVLSISFSVWPCLFQASCLLNKFSQFWQKKDIDKYQNHVHR